ncbi:MAG: HAD-IC family P-type ATPase [Dehalococcoidia bacterium]
MTSDPGQPRDAERRGLTSAEVAARVRHGLVNAEPANGDGDWAIVRRNVVSFFNIVLAVLIVALLATGEFRDGLLVGAVVIANVALATLQEIVATRRLRTLRALTAPRATVLRDGVEREVAASEVVLGDVLVLRRGDQVVADGPVLAGQAEVDESLLTGESSSIRRGRGDELRAGVFGVAGEVHYRADRVGTEAYALRLTAEARGLVRRASPLLLRFERLLRVILIATGLLAAILFIQFNVEGRGFTESLKATTATVTTIVPVGLLLGITVVTAVGALRVSRSGAIVHDLNSVEALNYVDVIAFDKTGTLTSNRLVLDAVHWTPGRADDDAWLRAFAAATAGESATSTALAEGLGAAPPGARAVASVPFSSERRWSAASVAIGDGGTRTFVLGAPETVLAGGEGGQAIAAAYDQASGAGLRGVVIAEAPALPDPHEALVGLTPLALLTFRDELRREVAEAFALMEQLRITPKIISGDHPETVAALLGQLGVEVDGVVAGSELERLDGAAFEDAVERTMVFGRISPALKRRIVTSLAERGHYVAMVGDGANDVLALRAADVAVAMASGAAIARGVAGIVLLNDSFTALIRGTREATFILGNTERLAKLFVAKSAYAYVLIFATNLLGLEFPFLPRQGSVFSTLSLGIPALLVAFSAPPPRTPREILNRIVRFALPAGVAVGVCTMTLQFIVEGLLGRDVEEARTLVSLTLTVVGLAFFVQVVGLEDASLRVPWRPIATAIVAATLGAILVAIVRTATTREFFGFTDVSAVGWASVVIASVAALIGQYLLSRHWRDLLRFVSGQWRSAAPQRGRDS